MATRNILTRLKAERDALQVLFEDMESTTDRAAKRRTGLRAKVEANLLPRTR